MTPSSDRAGLGVRRRAESAADWPALAAAVRACVACPELADTRSCVVVGGCRPPGKVLPTYHPSAALRWGPAGEPMRLLREDLALAAAAT